VPLDRPPRAPSPRITPQIADAVFQWIEQTVDRGLVGIAARYLEEEVHPNEVSALLELEQRYGLEEHELATRYALALQASAERVTAGRPVSVETALQLTPKAERARPFLQTLPEPELLTALEMSAPTAIGSAGQRVNLLLYLEKVFRARGLPYTALPGEGIRYVGEQVVREQAIEPALVALANPVLVIARAEFEKALGCLRRGEFKDAGRSAGDAVETTMAALLDNYGHPQPRRTPHGTDLVQANKLFDQLKSKEVRALNEDRDKDLIYAPMKVRNVCAHGAGANPPPDPAYVEAGVAAAAIAITYLHSKFK
jgi:hypothetical protein